MDENSSVGDELTGLSKDIFKKKLDEIRSCPNYAKLQPLFRLQAEALFQRHFSLERKVWNKPVLLGMGRGGGLQGIYETAMRCLQSFLNTRKKY